MSKQPVLYVIVPCYNEQEVLPITAPLFLNELTYLITKDKIADSSRILFIDDGSKDSSWEIISQLARKDKHYIGAAQSRNRGQQSCELAGFKEAEDHCDITVTIDCDGQDDITAIEKMVDAYKDGYEIVYGVRSKRASDSAFKRITAEGFYKVMNWLGAETVYNHSEYRMISNRVLHELDNYKEVNLFLRGIVPMVGFRSTVVYYERTERIAGKTHYSVKKLFELAFTGITNLSVKPLQMIIWLGVTLTLVGMVGLIWTAVTKSLVGALAFLIIMLSGMQLGCLGIVGEYTGKTYLEVKERPRWIIEKRTPPKK